MAQPLFVRPLTEAEREALTKGANSPSREEAWRAQLILRSADGVSAGSISQELGFHPSNVKKWIRRFNEDGLDGIVVRKRGPRSGPKPRFESEQVNAIVKLARTDPGRLGYGFKNWTTQKLASAAVERGIVDRISHVTIRQILIRQKVALGEGNGEPKELSGVAERPQLFLGRRAFERSDFEEAARHLHAATQECQTAEEEAAVRCLLSSALEELSRYDEAYEAVRKYEDSNELNALSLSGKANAKLRLGWVKSWLWDPPKAIASMNEAMRMFLELQDQAGISETHYALARTYYAINELAIARDHLLVAIRVDPTELSREQLAKIYLLLGTVYLSEGALPASKENYLKALQYAEGSSNTNLLGCILVNLGTACDDGYESEREESADYIRRGTEFLEKGGGHKDFLAVAYNNLADILKYSGRWDEAMKWLYDSVELASHFPDPRAEATARITLAEILSARGECDQAEEHLRKTLIRIGDSSDKWTQGNALRVLASVQKGLGQPQSALRSLRQALRLFTSIGDLHAVTLTHVALAEIHFFQGGVAQAREYVELAHARLKEEKSQFFSGLIQRLLGVLSCADGRVAEAKQHLAQSIAIFTATGIPYEVARSHYEMGLLLERLGDRKVAESHSAEATKIFEALGYRPTLEGSESLLERINFGDYARLESTAPTASSNSIATPGDALLMQRLIDAARARDFLLDELVSIVYEHFPVTNVILCSIGEAGKFEPIVCQGCTYAEAKDMCRSLDSAVVDHAGKFEGGYIVRISEQRVELGQIKESASAMAVVIREREAFDYSRLHPLIRQLEQGLEMCWLRSAVNTPQPAKVDQGVRTIMPGFIVGSAAMRDVIEKIHKIRTSDVTVLITGESGTGKELVARAIHAESARARAIFLPFNCTATPKDLIDSQLFGHRRGAFTGATANYPGIIRAAEGGTLFLDEIGDLALEVQPKLMRFLQEGEIQPLGETKPIKVDVRVLAATNSDLERAVTEGRFREDLFHRLNIIRIHVPSLRDRNEEIPGLSSYFLDHFASRSGKHGLQLSQEAIDILCVYGWPGNVRQLRNEMERVVTYATENTRIGVNDLSPEIVSAYNSRREQKAFGIAQGGWRIDEQAIGSLSNRAGGRTEVRTSDSANHAGCASQPVNIKEATALLERQLILEALARNKNNLTRTAVDIGLSRRGLRLKLVQLGIARS